MNTNKGLLIKIIIGAVIVAVFVVGIIRGITGSDNGGTAAAPDSSGPSVPAVTSSPSADDGGAPSNPTSPGPPMDDDSGLPKPKASTPPPTDQRPPTKVGRKGTPRGLKLNLSKVNRKDPDKVAAAFGTILGCYDTKIDTGPNDAGRRAAVLADSTLAKSLKHATSVTGPDADWTTLADHHGYTTVKVELGGLGPMPSSDPSSNITYRPVTLTIQRHGDKWKPAADFPQTVMLTLTRAKPGAAWAVSKIDYL